MMRSVLLLALLAVPALAKPPAASPFMRMDELEPKLADLHNRLLKAEEFRKKPRQERMILRFGAGDATFEGKKFSDRGFVEEILVRWQAVQKIEEECNASDLQILQLLPVALRKRYSIVPIPKAERYQASKVLVKALKSKHKHIRQTAIDCLDAVYGRTLMYRADASPGMRIERYNRWRKEIEKLKR